jgi:hypothetical protein
MGRYQPLPTAPASQIAKGGGIDNQKYALVDPKTKQPVANGSRNVWVTETALATALEHQLHGRAASIFGTVVGIALLLSGIGFALLTIGGALRRRLRPAAEAPG